MVNSAATSIVHHGKKDQITQILEYIKLDPYKEWEEIDQAVRGGLRELFLQWSLSHN